MSEYNNLLSTVFFGAADHRKFCEGLQTAIHQVPPAGIYTGDNLFTYGRNLGFMDDEPFMNAYRKNISTDIEQALLWRYSTLIWAVRRGLQLEGDFVECACYKGTTARIMCDAVDFGQFPERHYYLYDLFEHDPAMPHHAMPEHSKQLYQQTRQRFADLPNVTVTQGKVPDVLHDVAPEKIAFMHIDLNNADAEIGALELLFERMVPGAILILDDYGWLAYRAQKEAEDPWLAARGYRVLELPTGQGIVIK